MMSPMDYKYSLLSAGSPDDYGHGSSVLLRVDDMPVSLFAVLGVKRADVGSVTAAASSAWHRGALGFLDKLKVCSFMCFLTVAFLLVTASYMLLADRKGLLLTPPPYRFDGVVGPGLGVGVGVGAGAGVGAAFDFGLSSSARDLAHTRLVVKSIASRVEFHSGRRVPERKSLVGSEPHVSEIKEATVFTVRYTFCHKRHVHFVTKWPRCAILISELRSKSNCEW